MAITRQKEGEERHVHPPAVHLDGKELAPPPPAGTWFEPNHRLWSMKELAATRAKREGRAVEAETEVGARFDESTSDSDGVRYLNAAGDAAHRTIASASPARRSPFGHDQSPRLRVVRTRSTRPDQSWLL
jgi:hypothetical protein